MHGAESHFQNKKGTYRHVRPALNTCLVGHNLRMQAEIVRLKGCMAPIFQAKRRQTYCWSVSTKHKTWQALHGPGATNKAKTRDQGKVMHPVQNQLCLPS